MGADIINVIIKTKLILTLPTNTSAKAFFRQEKLNIKKVSSDCESDKKVVAQACFTSTFMVLPASFRHV